MTLMGERVQRVLGIFVEHAQECCTWRKEEPFSHWNSMQQSKTFRAREGGKEVHELGDQYNSVTHICSSGIYLMYLYRILDYVWNVR